MAEQPFGKKTLAARVRLLLVPRLLAKTGHEWVVAAVTTTTHKTTEGRETYTEAKFHPREKRVPMVASLGISTISPPRGIVHYAGTFSVSGSVRHEEQFRTDNPKAMGLWLDNLLLGGHAIAPRRKRGEFDASESAK
jgi:hypothetical protein